VPPLPASVWRRAAAESDGASLRALDRVNAGQGCWPRDLRDKALAVFEVEGVPPTLPAERGDILAESTWPCRCPSAGAMHAERPPGAEAGAWVWRLALWACTSAGFSWRCSRVSSAGDAPVAPASAGGSVMLCKLRERPSSGEGPGAARGDTTERADAIATEPVPVTEEVSRLGDRLARAVEVAPCLRAAVCGRVGSAGVVKLSCPPCRGVVWETPTPGALNCRPGERALPGALEALAAVAPRAARGEGSITFSMGARGDGSEIFSGGRVRDVREEVGCRPCVARCCIGEFERAVPVVPVAVRGGGGEL